MEQSFFGSGIGRRLKMEKSALAKFIDSVISVTRRPASAMVEKPFPRLEVSSPMPLVPMSKELDDFRAKIEGTNIDSRSFLSTDYFNVFNSVVMIVDMLPDCPEMLDDVEQWAFVDYEGHFRSSGLDFADLAIEGYALSPKVLRLAFDQKVEDIRLAIETVRANLRGLADAGEKEAFFLEAREAAARLRVLMEEGNAIVHGRGAVGQEDVDKLF